MKAIYRTIPRSALAGGAALSALLSACVPAVQAPAPVAAPPPPRPAQALPPAPTDWHDMPATPGEWQWHREGPMSIARFGEPTAPSLLSLTCDPLAGTITLLRSGAPGAAAAISIVTTSLSRRLTARPASDGAVSVALPARDPLLDAMAFSRGRFAVEVPGLASLYLPSWAEVGRVIEDCREPVGRAGPAGQ